MFGIRTRAAAVVALLVVAACEGDLVFGPKSFEGGDEVRRGLALCRRVWESKGPERYEMRFRWLCFCPPEYVDWAVVTVEDGVVTAARFVDGDVPVPPAELDRYRTVEGLFDVLEDGLDQGADDIRFAADESLAYPLRAYIDYERGTADEELGFEVNGITPSE